MFNFVRGLFSPNHQQAPEMHPGDELSYYPPMNQFVRSASKNGSFHGGYPPLNPHHPHNQVVEYYPPPPGYFRPQSKHSKLPPRTCASDSQSVLALFCFCVGIIVKGVAYGNSHWTNHDEIDFNNNREQFPIMTNFIDMKGGRYESSCEEMKCKIFFDKYNAMQMVAQAQNKPSVPLRGTFSRGVNSRCETIQLSGSSANDLVAMGSGNTGNAKYEKCVVDKQTEVNEYRTIRVLLVTSMVADGLGLIAWVVLFVRPPKVSINRLAMVIAALLGFISSLLTALAVGLFTQAVDIYDDPRMSLGWPFYLTTGAGFLALVAAFIAGGMLYMERRRVNKIEAVMKMRMMVHSPITPTVSIIEMERNGGAIVHGNFPAIEAELNADRPHRPALPAPPPVPTRSKSRENLTTDDSRSLKGASSNDHLNDAGSVAADAKSIRSTKPSVGDDVDSVNQSALAFTRNDSTMRSNRSAVDSVNQFRRNDSTMRSNRSAVDSLDTTVDRLYQGYRRNNPALRSNRSAFNQAI